LVDCLLGTGIRGRLRSPFDTLIPAVNRSGCQVVAIDLPSGLDADTGACDPEAIIADLTITLALPKTGLLTTGGLEYCGLLRCVDIGIPPQFAAEAEDTGEAVFRQDVTPLLPRRPRGGHKRTFGDLLVVGGSVPYAGAPMLAGAGALRQGTGLVQVAMPAAAATIAPRRFASLIVHPVGPASGRYFTAACVEDVVRLTQRAAALVFGCGVGKPREAAPILRALLQTRIPLLIDADGLRALAHLGADCAKRAAANILTPHPGEMRALLEGFEMTELLSASREEQAMQLARRIGAIVVLKGAGTVIASPTAGACVNSSGTTALATAGTGDVLAGVIGGLLAQGMNSWDACRCGTFVHGLAGEISPFGQRGMTADDLLDLIPYAIRLCSPFA
ncbi:MAG: NAD(P)H-hydrate dehydratase, partial [Verrucomicrobiota bacterium]